MSTPPSSSAAPAESRPSPWLVMAVPIVFSLLGFGVQWGTMGADNRNLERRQTATEATVTVLAESKGETKAQLSRIEEHVVGMDARVERLTNFVERHMATRTARDMP